MENQEKSVEKKKKGEPEIGDFGDVIVLTTRPNSKGGPPCVEKGFEAVLLKGGERSGRQGRAKKKPGDKKENGTGQPFFWSERTRFR